MGSANAYAVRITLFEDGERMPVLVDTSTGLPLYDPCVYACTELRLNTGSAATIEQALRGVQFLLTFIGERQIDLEGRFASARFLDMHELDDLVRTAYLPMGRTTESGRNKNSTTPKVISLDGVRRRSAKAQKEVTVALSTVAIRLYYACAYLEWLGHRATGQVCKTLEQKNEYMTLLREFLGRLRSRTPKARGQSSRLSLTVEQKSELLRVIDPRCPDNPWEGELVRERNRLIVLWGLGTGLRRGELLGLRIKLLNLRRNMADIVRRPDDKKDPRKYQPNAKTRERSIGFDEELAYLTHEHIVKHRSKLRGAQKHDFLFVASDTGQPLSLAALSKVFRTLRERHPAVGNTLSSHVLRHTWNEDFSDVADKAGLAPEDERRARNHAMGWSDFSSSSDNYLKRRTRRLATDVSVKIQKAVVGETAKGGRDE